MNVLFIPFSQENPYQKELARYMKNHDVDVIMKDEESILPILKVVFFTGKPDILHLHWTHTIIKSRNTVERVIKGIRFLGEIIFLKMIRVKIIWTVHNISDHDFEKNRIENVIHKYFLMLCDMVIVHCEDAIKAVKLYYKKIGLINRKICVIPHGNYIESYKNDISSEKARKLLGFESHETVFGFFGNIRSYKGVFDLVQAFQELEEPCIRLLLVGKPQTYDLEKKLQRIANDDNRISLILGYVPAKRIQIYLNCMDVIVLPFRKILTSGSALLAMSFGKPVVAPNSGCLKELFGDNGNFLYEADNEKSLIDAMKKSLKADLRELGKHNFDLALKAGWKFSAKQTAEVYKTILE